MIKNAVVLGLIFSAHTLAFDLENTYPTTEIKYLDDGTEISVPFHVKGEATSAVLGLVNAKRAKRFLWNDGWKVVTPKCDGKSSGKGIAAFYTQKITESPAGAYNETVATFFIQRRNAPDLDLPCPSDLNSLEAQVNYAMAAFTTINTANAEKQSMGLPHDYASFNFHLMLDNAKAVEAGEIWGYPKQLAQVDITLSENTHRLELAKKNGKPLLSAEYQRKIGTNTPLYSVGDNVVPSFNLPDESKIPQLSGVLTSASGWILPFVGKFTIHSPKSVTTRFLRKTQFTPIAVLEFTNVEGVALPLYDK